MKKLLFILTLSTLSIMSTATVLADPIEGRWTLNEPLMKKSIHTLPKSQQGLFAMMMMAMKDINFYKNGKLRALATNAQGTWKKKGQGYSLSVDGSIVNAYLNKSVLQLRPTGEYAVSKPLIYKRKAAISAATRAKNKRVEAMIQYDRKYRRTRANPDGSATFLVISRAKKTCTITSPNKNGHGRLRVSDSCFVDNGRLNMGLILGMADVISANKIKHGKDIYILSK